MFSKKGVLKISQNSPENILAMVSEACNFI